MKLRLLVICLVLIVCCHHRVTLPSRPLADLFPQAISPPPNCPGQYPLYVDVDNGQSLFLECFGHRGLP